MGTVSAGRRPIRRSHRQEALPPGRGPARLRPAARTDGYHGRHQHVWGAIRNPFPKLDREFRLIKETGAGVSNYNSYDRRIANRTVEWLKERADKDEGPWALYVGLAAPHPPFIVPREFLDHYPLDKVPIPKTYAVPGTERHPKVKAQAEFIGQDKHFKDDEERRRAYASYLGLLIFVDAQVGFILDMLTQTGLA